MKSNISSLIKAAVIAGFMAGSIAHAADKSESSGSPAPTGDTKSEKSSCGGKDGCNCKDKCEGKEEHQCTDKESCKKHGKHHMKDKAKGKAEKEKASCGGKDGCEHKDADKAE